VTDGARQDKAPNHRRVFVDFRHCEERSDEAIQFFFAALDCFASLAMTGS
jgi:hypothetical protein